MGSKQCVLIHGASILSCLHFPIPVIPDYAKMRWLVRAPSAKEVETLRERVVACFRSDHFTASLAESLFQIL